MIVVVSTSIIISIIFSAVVLILKNPLSILFTSDAEVIEAVSNLTPLLAISVFLNGIQPILSGKSRHISDHGKGLLGQLALAWLLHEMDQPLPGLSPYYF